MNWKKKKPGGHVHVACKFKMQHTQIILEQKKKINKKEKKNQPWTRYRTEKRRNLEDM